MDNETCAELLATAVAVLDRLDNMTTEEFSKGGERAERERLRAAIAKATATAGRQS